jgi:hypothetical protein
MNIKKIVIVGTMAFVITLSPVFSGYSSTDVALNPAQQADQSTDRNEDDRDPVIEALGLNNEEALYEDLLQGHSLTDIALKEDKNIDQVIQLQVTQLKEQIHSRFIEGSLSEEQYLQQIDEVPDIIASSVLQRYDLA